MAALILLGATVAGLLLDTPEPFVAAVGSPQPRAVTAPSTQDREPPVANGQSGLRPRLERASRSVRGVAREPVTSGLDVTMETLEPSLLQAGSPVQVTGTITDVEEENWGNLKVYLVIDKVPSVRSEGLDTVLASEPDAVTGERIFEAGFFAELGDLGPGDSLGYELDVPFRLLGLDVAPAGVYTVGVHVLADTPEGLRVTAGRARTLMPLLPPSTATPPVDLTVVLPLRTPVVREADGAYVDLEGVLDLIGPGGRIRNLLDLAASTEPGGTSVLVDPALIDLLLAVVADDFGPPVEGAPPEGAGAEGEQPGSGSDPEQGSATDLQTPVDGLASSADRRSAADFLTDLAAVADDVELLAEPYGAADMSAVVELGSRSLQRSVARVGRSALERAGLEASQILLPDSPLAPEQLRPVSRGRTLVLGSEQVRGWDVTDGAGSWLAAADADPEDTTPRRGDIPAVVVDETLAQGGPQPGRTDSVLQIRQRLLAETAVLSLGAAASGDAAITPGLVHLPAPDWDPGVGLSGSDFFDELEVPWISSVDLPGQLPTQLRDAGAARVRPADPEDPAPGVSLSVVEAARDIRSRATLLQSLFDADSTMLRWYGRATALTVSSYLREEPLAAVAIAEEVSGRLDDQIGRISVEGPEFVTLSSDSGSFPVTVTNNLSRPITVGLSLRDSARALQFDEVPLETIEAGDSAQLTLEVGAPDVGVTEVTATLVSRTGRAFGTPATFNLRSSVVGAVIWVAFGAGAVFFVLLVVRRVGRRIVASRRSRVAP